MEIRRIHPDEGPQLRAIRLKALSDTPDAFAVSLADAEKDPEERWEGRAKRASSGDMAVTLIAIEDSVWYGMVSGFLVPEQPHVAQLVAMWVDPTRRRQGVALSMVEGIIQWAREREAKNLQLWVTETNSAAKALYASTGFRHTDKVQLLPHNPILSEVMMVLDLQS